MPTTVGAAATWIGANAGTISAVSAAAGAAAGVYGQQQSRSAQSEAQRQQKAQQSLQAGVEKPQTPQTPDITQIQKRNAQLAAASGQLGGMNSTLLTGSQGVASSALGLGTSTLLGQ